MGTATASATKFDSARAAEYATQSRIALAGYDACHELAACVLAAALGRERAANILVVGAGGTGQEIVTAGALEPEWRFTAVDPSEPMLALAEGRIAGTPVGARTTFHRGTTDDLPGGASFDAASMIGVLHHVQGDDAKRAVLRSIASRLDSGAPFILAGNYRPYASQPLFLAAWAERWRMHGAEPAEVRAKLDKILHAADPPTSEEAVSTLLAQAGFGEPTRFFASLFWGAWITRRV